MGHKEKVLGEASAHQHMTDLTFMGTLLCSAKDGHRLKCLSLHAEVPLEGEQVKLNIVAMSVCALLQKQPD